MCFWKRFGCLLLAVCLSFSCFVRPAHADTDARTEAVEAYMSRLTLREKICQMMVVYQYRLPHPNGSGYVSATETGDVLRRALQNYPVGGILYDAGSMVSHAQLRNLVSTAASYSEVPLLFSIDEEGGRVARIGNKLGYETGDKLNAMMTYQDQGPDVAKSNALFLARNIASHGFNWDYAPVADVNSNPANPVIGTRAYSNSFDTAEVLIPAAIAGFHEGGVACSLKHFPGHGDTSSDSHYGAVSVYKSVAEIRQNELRSFQAGIDAGTDSVMIAHIQVEEIGVPSLFSYELLTTILRDEMGFSGVEVSDGLTMKAMTDHYSAAYIAVESIKAGNDVLLCINDLDVAIEALENAVETGDLTEDRIDESVRRILGMKYDLGLLQ